MKIEKTFKRLEGTQTIETVMDTLEINKKKAIYYIHRLRKKNYVKTKRLSNNRRVYNISFENRLKNINYYEIINKHSPIKITTPFLHNVYGKEPSLEETLIFAIKTHSLRTILASLALFKKIKDWSKLYQLAKRDNLEREVGALYDLSRKFMLTKRMTKRFRNNALPKAGCRWTDIIPKLRSDHFKVIEKKWKVYLPFNQKDLEAYKKQQIIKR